MKDQERKKREEPEKSSEEGSEEKEEASEERVITLRALSMEDMRVAKSQVSLRHLVVFGDLVQKKKAN